jgi:hypothetical protein
MYTASKDSSRKEVAFIEAFLIGVLASLIGSLLAKVIERFFKHR